MQADPCTYWNKHIHILPPQLVLLPISKEIIRPLVGNLHINNVETVGVVLRGFIQLMMMPSRPTFPPRTATLLYIMVPLERQRQQPSHLDDAMRVHDDDSARGLLHPHPILSQHSVLHGTIQRLGNLREGSSGNRAGEDEGERDRGTSDHSLFQY